jgi:hypothetical protein
MERSTVRRTMLVMLVGIAASAWMAGAAAAATGPAVVGAISNSTSLSGTMAVAVSGNFAFDVSYWSGQLNVIDISNPATPKVVASTPSTPQMIGATNVTIVGTHALVTSKNQNGTCNPGPIPSCANGSNDDGNGNSLTVVDISNPLAPAVIGTPVQSSTELFGAYAVAVSGNFAYVASQGLLNQPPNPQPASPDTSTGSFTVIDLTAGSIVASIDNSSLSGALANGLDHATGVSISGSYAYVTAFYGDRLTTIDISTPTSPIVKTSLHDSTNLNNPNDVATQGNYAYVANQTLSGLEFAVVNISNPLAPAVVGSLSDTHLVGAYRVRVSGNLAYVSANSSSSVAAIDVSNPSAPRLVGSVTDTHLANVDGISLSSTGRYLITTAPRLSTEPAVAYPPFPLQTGGPTVNGTVAVIDLEPSPLSVSIAPASEPASQTTQNSASFSFAVSDAVTTVQCSLDGAAMVACTTPNTANYGSLGTGTHTFTVQATDSTGATAHATYTWTVGSTPVNTSPPTISGTAQQSRKLTVTPGIWSGTPTPAFSYQWELCNAKGTNCNSISNQTNSNYTVPAADVGLRLEVVVNATNFAGSASATSAATKTVSWSSAAFASATLSKSKTTSPGFSLSIPAPGGNLKLHKLVISLPKGLSFAATKKVLAAGTSVKDLRGKRLAFVATLSHGKLILTFKKPPTGVKLTVRRGLVSISGALERRIKSHKAKTERVSLTLSYTGKPSRTGAIKLRLA